MTAIQPLETWDVLREIGFQPVSTSWSDIQPGLGYSFGNLTLCASAVTTGWRLTPVVLFTGVMLGQGCIAKVQFEMPRNIESIEKCCAWITWNLDQCSDGEFRPIIATEWLALGRSNKLLLPWVIDTEAYERRPQCSVERGWASMMLKRLRTAAGLVPDDTPVSFEFDGELLRIRCGSALIPGAAEGTAWQDRYILKALQLRELPRRLVRPMVWFSFWDGHFEIANWSYEGVVVDKVQNDPPSHGESLHA